MSLTRSIAIQPTIVNEVIEELLDTDIIHPNKINQLKNENEMPYYDPNILMDIRHKQVKHKNCSTYKESINMGIRTTNKTSSQPNVNFLQVDKEIEKFKKELEIERKKLYELNNKTTKKIPDKVNRELKDNELFIKKNKNIINNGSIFANRLNAQKTVIQEQKLKLEEQNKLIQQLFEEKLKEQIKETNKNILSNLQETAKNCNSNLKPKVKVLANSSSIYMDSKKPTDCTFVKRMNQREQERRERWEISRMRKQLIEDEKKKKEVEEEQKKREEEEEMRKKKILEKKEKIKLQREIELKKLLCAEEIKRKMEIAKEHYNSYLLKKIINVFKKNIQYKKQLECECTNYCNKKLLNLYFKEWKKNAQYSFYSEAVQKLQVAEDFYDAKLSEKTFNKWKIFTNKQRIEYEKRIEYAINHYNRNLLKNYFNRLKQLPLKMYKTREEEKRIRLWRDKVLEIIPDYTPELESDD
ncbi:uncharacterized protein LOC142326952 [Lycorma delicatula]|uniref:uncharacterized protein LOC142326952 n=1 Tax=Lycorma delicatula TaxID=130591 RepID=UPI003F51A36B